MAKKSNAAQYGNVGAEDVSRESLSVSFIKLVQKSSNVPGAKPGDVVDSVSGQKMKLPLVVVPIKKFIDWVKFDDDFMICGRSTDGKVWDDGTALDKDEVWKNKRINFFVYLEDQDTESLPYCISFGKTSYKTGSKMENISDKHILMDGAPIFSQKFSLNVSEEKFGKYTSWVWNVALAGDVENEDFLTDANKMRETISAKLNSKSSNLLAEHTEAQEEEKQKQKAKGKRRF